MNLFQSATGIAPANNRIGDIFLECNGSGLAKLTAWACEIPALPQSTSQRFSNYNYA